MLMLMRGGGGLSHGSTRRARWGLRVREEVGKEGFTLRGGERGDCGVMIPLYHWVCHVICLFSHPPSRLIARPPPCLSRDMSNQSSGGSRFDVIASERTIDETWLNATATANANASRQVYRWLAKYIYRLRSR